MTDERYEPTKEDITALLAAIQRLVSLFSESGELRKANTRYRDMLQKHADLMEETRGILDKVNIFDGILREFIEESSRQLGDIERLMLLERTGNEDSREAERVRGRMQKRQDDKVLRELLEQETLNRDKLLLKVAKYGGDMSAPLFLMNQLDKVNENIERIKEELGIVD